MFLIFYFILVNVCLNARQYIYTNIWSIFLANHSLVTNKRSFLFVKFLESNRKSLYTIQIFLRENKSRVWKKSFVRHVTFVVNSFENLNTADFLLLYFLQFFIEHFEDISVERISRWKRIWVYHKICSQATSI